MNQEQHRKIREAREAFLRIKGNFRGFCRCEPNELNARCTHCYDFLEVQSALFNIQPAQEWVPISQPPKEEGRVLAYYDLSKEGNGATWKDYEVVTFHPETACVPPAFGISSLSLKTCRYTHWQPLPAPPVTPDEKEGV